MAGFDCRDFAKTRPRPLSRHLGSRHLPECYFRTNFRSAVKVLIALRAGNPARTIIRWPGIGLSAAPSLLCALTNPRSVRSWRISDSRWASSSSLSLRGPTYELIGTDAPPVRSESGSWAPISLPSQPAVSCNVVIGIVGIGAAPHSVKERTRIDVREFKERVRNFRGNSHLVLVAT